MATITFLEPGTDATQDASFFANFLVGGSGTIASDTTHAHVGTRSIKCASLTAGDQGRALTNDGVCADAGSAISFWIYCSAVSVATPAKFLGINTSAGGSSIIGVGLNTTSNLRVCGRGATAVDGATMLLVNTWYRVTCAYTLTSGTNWGIKVYLNGVLEITSGQGASGFGLSNGTISATGTTSISFGLAGSAAIDTFGTVPSGLTIWLDSLYVDNRTDCSDPGAIDVTAKRPVANGTTNGFTTQIGSGGSGYGTGHSPQVNEQPLSQTNGWSMVGAGSAITEEYLIEGLAVGDVNLTGTTLVGVQGWVFSKSLSSETAKILVDGTSTNISLTSTAAMFTQNSATPTVYPAGTGSDIGEITSTGLTTVSLYECGVLVAYLPGGGMAALPPGDALTALERGKTYPLDLRTFLQSVAQQLIGKDLQFGAPGQPQSYDWPLPTPRTYPLDLRTFLEGPPLNLVGKDQQFGGAGQTRDYDWPLPVPRAYPLDLRTFLQAVAIQLAGSFYGAAGQVPAYDWPNPTWRFYPLDLRTFLQAVGLDLINQGQQFGAPGQGQSYDWPLPTSKTYPADLRTFLQSLQEATLQPAPVVPAFNYDWPTPTPRAYPLDLRTWIQYYVIDQNTPFAQTDWPLPQGRTYPLDLRTFVSNVLAGITITTVPFVESDWPLPTPRTYPLDLRTFVNAMEILLQGQDQFFSGPGVGPDYDWPLPTWKVYPSDLRTYTRGTPLQFFGQDRFYGGPGEVPSYDWPLPIPRAYPPQFRATLLASNFPLFNAPPPILAVGGDNLPMGWDLPESGMISPGTIQGGDSGGLN